MLNWRDNYHVQVQLLDGFLAGAGKSNMLETAADAWRKQGVTVYGAALAGKVVMLRNKCSLGADILNPFIL